VYDRVVEPITAFILAGGKSSRMGQDKAFLQFEGKTLLARALAAAGSVASDVRIVGDPERFGAYGVVVEDVVSGCGPLGGIHAALKCASTDLSLILAVDLPFVSAQYLRYLIEQATLSRATITLARTADGWQPLCAAYRREFLPIAEQALLAGRRKIDELFSHVELRVLQANELALQGMPPELFCNLNTAEDVEQALGNLRRAANPID